MELVHNIRDMLENAKRFDAYLTCGTSEEKDFALEKITSGRCFVVAKKGNLYQFYPSKFIGYQNNSVSAYAEAYDHAYTLPGTEKYGDAANASFDGRVSNRAINKVLGCTCEKDYELSEKFISFCHKYGLKGSGKKKFWKNIIEI